MNAGKGGEKGFDADARRFYPTLGLRYEIIFIQIPLLYDEKQPISALFILHTAQQVRARCPLCFRSILKCTVIYIKVGNKAH